jgi:hypothetical protein
MENGFPHNERRNSNFVNRENNKFKFPIHRKEGFNIQNESIAVQEKGSSIEV